MAVASQALSRKMGGQVSLGIQVVKKKPQVSVGFTKGPVRIGLEMVGKKPRIGFGIKF